MQKKKGKAKGQPNRHSHRDSWTRGLQKKKGKAKRQGWKVGGVSGGNGKSNKGKSKESEYYHEMPTKP